MALSLVVVSAADARAGWRNGSPAATSIGRNGIKPAPAGFRRVHQNETKRMSCDTRTERRTQAGEVLGEGSPKSEHARE